MPSDSTLAPDFTGLRQRIQAFYDASSGLWESVWGEHMHHGYYPLGDPRPERRQAQIDLIDRLLEWCEVKNPQQILDLGCGIGGSSLVLAERFQAQVTGITLSPIQAKRATSRAQEKGLSTQTQFYVADALEMPFPAGSFDFVWSLESGEHMPDKAKFLAECHRVLKPGGRLLLVTWCHRSGSLSAQDRQQLQKIYDVYCLPYILSLADYQQLAEQTGFQYLKLADWSKEVAPFWDLVMESAWDMKVIWQLLTKGWPTLRAALSLRLMANGYASGLIRYGLLTGIKP
ncbi:MAG: methyltransferase domain-containing protein [Cyanobacteriota bacterium]|nr:methyltransferase domain-containing protein [Cyanobacteriota bacterium]